jgi:hypothetical protein
MKKAVKILAVIGSVLMVGVVLIAVLGFVAYRNLFPAMDRAEAAETVGNFKLRKAFPVKGNILGTTVSYFLEYETDNGGKKNAITYSLRKFWSESGAIEDFQKTECGRADLAKEGVVKDKNGNPVGDFRYCSGTLHFRNGARSVSVYKFVIGRNDYAPDDVVINFVKNLLINSEVDLASFTPASPLFLTESKKTADTNASTDGSKSAFDLIREQKETGGSLSPHNGREFTVRGYVVSAAAKPSTNNKGLLLLYDREDIVGSNAGSLGCWYDESDHEAFSKIKGRQFVTVKGVFDGSSMARLNDCRLVSIE